jgi:hypothetical protein
MLKSPSAKELGRHRVQPINSSNIYRKPEDAKGRGLAAQVVGSKLAGSQRTQCKVSRQSLATARPLTSASHNQTSLGVKRTKFTPSSGTKAMGGKPPTRERTGTGLN